MGKLKSTGSVLSVLFVVQLSCTKETGLLTTVLALGSIFFFKMLPRYAGGELFVSWHMAVVQA